jgi:predicted AAA+ superfamily ATPase
MFSRNIEPEIRAALTDTPVVLLNGARQTGKSTLAIALAAEFGMRYVTLDDATALAAASADALGFLKGLGASAVIDEVQKAPTLFPAIKALVDADRRPGRYLLTGSANVLLLPKLSESLAGRVEIISLAPLSQGELEGRREGFIDAAFRPGPLENPGGEGVAPLDRILAGGYPEAVGRPAGKRRDAWFASYITAILQRDVRDLAHIEGLTDMPRLLSLLAARTGGLLNMSELSRSCGIAQTTLKRYLSLLEATFLFQPLPAWSANLGKRLVRSPKIHLADIGLAAFLTGHTPERLASDPTHLGRLWESFVVGELRKQATWSEARVRLYHYRTTAGQEVDIVLESAAGSLLGVEVKAASTVVSKDFAGLRALVQDAAGRVVRGVILYAGDRTVAFGDQLVAIPLPALWRI